MAAQREAHKAMLTIKVQEEAALINIDELFKADLKAADKLTGKDKSDRMAASFKALLFRNGTAEITDTVNAIFKYKGILYKKHLQRGVVKAAFSQEEADKKFAQWVDEHKNKVLDHAKKHHKDKSEIAAKLLEQEQNKATERDNKRKAALEAANKATEEANAPAVETTEAPAAEVTEAPVADVTETEPSTRCPSRRRLFHRRSRGAGALPARVPFRSWV